MIEWITNPFLFTFGLAGAQASPQIRKSTSCDVNRILSEIKKPRDELSGFFI